MNYTGHPFFDIGLATVCCLVSKQDPVLLTTEDFEFVADYLEENYTRDPLKSFLGVAFTTNAWFNQPAFDKQPEKRHDYASRLLRSYDDVNEESDQRCVFTGEPVTSAAFSDKLPPGRAFRQHIPLLTGEGVINFHPGGDAGLPVSGKASLCLQAFPLGCAKCGGKLLAVHADNPEVTYFFARKFWEENSRLIHMAQQANSKKMPEAPLAAKTLLVDKLIGFAEFRRLEIEDERPVSITAYHLTNSGQSNALDQTNPPLAIYYLPIEITDFLRHVRTNPLYREQWNVMAGRAWYITKAEKKGAVEQETKSGRRNLAYEDLFGLPENAATFIRKYLLPVSVRNWDALYNPIGSAEAPAAGEIFIWPLTELFLEKVIGMNKGRIEKIRALGDTLAAYVAQDNDRKFFMAVYTEQRYDFFRNALVKADFAWVKKGNPPLLTLDSYLDVFEEMDSEANPDWRLARDLMLIRMIEELYRRNWLQSNKDVITEDTHEQEEGGQV